MQHGQEQGAAVIQLDGVTLVRDGATVLRGIDWHVRSGERWVVLGPNGSGKTSLVSIASMWSHPTSGTVVVADGRLGSVDVRRHRAALPVVSAAVGDLLRPGIAALDVVVTAKHAALEAWWHRYGADNRAIATRALERFRAGHLAERTFGTLSTGERQRVLLARATAFGAAVVFLDEPMAGLDLGAREDLVELLADLAADPGAPPLVLVTHHVDEIPAGFTHGLLLAGGRVHASGTLEEVLTAGTLSELYGRPLELERRHGRWLSVAPRR